MNLDEMYLFMSGKMKDFYNSGEETIEIDEKHWFELFHMVCYMMQIRKIFKQTDVK